MNQLFYIFLAFIMENVSIISLKSIIEARWCSMANTASELSRSWLIDEHCHVFNTFPSLLNSLSADATVTGIVKKF